MCAVSAHLSIALIPQKDIVTSQLSADTQNNLYRYDLKSVIADGRNNVRVQQLTEWSFAISKAKYYP